MAGAKFTTTAHATVAATDKIPALKSTTKGYLTPQMMWPPGHLFGMTMSNNGSDATNDIDFAAGSCLNSTNVVPMIGSALTKQLDVAWAAGTNAGGKMSAAAITNTTYHCFAILKDSDNSVDYGFDVSATAPTMPTGYTYFRRIGSILRESAAIVAFNQVGDLFRRSIPTADYSQSAPGTSAVTVTLKVPIGIRVEADISALLLDATPAVQSKALLTALAQADSLPASFFQLYIPTAGAGVPAADTFGGRIMTDTAAGIRLRLDNSTADHLAQVYTHGWVDSRGRVA